jgi:hypothetical protein
MSLLVLYFNPSNLLEPDASFEALSNRLIVPPVVETLVYSKFRGAVSLLSTHMYVVSKTTIQDWISHCLLR